jgi:hypothetical protein
VPANVTIYAFNIELSSLPTSLQPVTLTGLSYQNAYSMFNWQYLSVGKIRQRGCLTKNVVLRTEIKYVYIKI